MILPYHDKSPAIDPTVYIAKGAVVTGDVVIGEYSSIWYNAVIRGDVSPTVIGCRVNIQDNSTLHQSPRYPLILEDDVSIGHNVVLHSCHIKQGAIIGMGSIIMDGAEIGENSMVGAGTLVTQRKKMPSGVLIMGTPAKVIRELNEAELADILRIQRTYVEKGQYYKKLEEQT